MKPTPTDQRRSRDLQAAPGWRTGSGPARHAPTRYRRRPAERRREQNAQNAVERGLAQRNAADKRSRSGRGVPTRPGTKPYPTDRRHWTVEAVDRACGRDQAFPAPRRRGAHRRRDLTFDVAPGEFVAVVGPTGCGKSTTLSLVSGLEPPSDGAVRSTARRSAASRTASATCSRTTRVLPWRTVLDNVAAGPRYRGRRRRPRPASRARDWIDRVGLAGFEDYYPHQLSGGMRKRVALAQTLVNEPRILLMDEPFCALDVQTRALMQDELLRLWAGTGAAVVFVTHDLEEAIALADRVVVMTAAPATVKDDLRRCDLPRPREVEEIRLSRSSWTSTGRSGPRCAKRSRSPAREEPAVSLDVGADARRGAASPTASRRARRRLRRRRRWPVTAGAAAAGRAVARLAGSWPPTYWIDPFYYSMPSAIWDQAGRLVHRRHRARLDLDADRRTPSRRPCSASCIGAIAGVVLGIAARPGPVPGRRAARRSSRRPTRSRASCWPRCSSSGSASADLQGRHRGRAGLLRGLLQRLPGRPRGGPQPRRQRPHPRAPAARRC